MDFAIISGVISWLTDNVPQIKSLWDKVPPNVKPWIFIILTGVIALVVNLLAVQGIGVNEPVSWEFLWNALLDWGLGLLSSQFTHVVVNKG